MTRAFPPDERYGLISQMRLAAVSISSNIAEGAGRGSRKELARFLHIAVGSMCELDSQLELAMALNLCEPGTSMIQDIDILRRRLMRLIGQIAPLSEAAPQNLEP
jgi:four helix bundle protein